MIRIGMLLSDRYEILEKIGSGGMSDVYKARCHKLNRLVAIKILKQEYSTDKNFVTKFWAEAQSAARLAHPNIVNVYDVGNDQGIYYIVMELVEGVTLKKYIEKKGKLEIRESIGIAMQVCQGMEAAHDQKIIHRDIKPQNIIISRDGKVKVTDFGIARAASTQTISSNAMGSVHYISPEQARGGYCDERSDIYSMGIVMYEMLTGVVPFEGESTVQVALMHIQSEMVPPRKYEPMIPVSLEKIIMKCTQKKPEARYSGVAALIADLRRALMTPDEDFVKMSSGLTSNDPTRVISTEEVEQIRNEVRSAPVSPAPSGSARTPAVDEEEEAYLMGYEDDEDLYEEEEEYEEEDEEETDPKFEKIITYISIGVAILIVILAIWILGRAFDIFGGKGGQSGTTAPQAENSTTDDGKTSPMPHLVGMTVGDAQKVLNSLDLGISIERVAAPNDEDGIVIDQEFPKGYLVDKHYQVKVVVCDNSAYATIPDGLVGSDFESVRSALLTAGLIVDKLEEFSEEVEAGIVMSMDQEAGAVLAKDSVVRVTVSKGPEIVRVAVPNVTGDSQDEAINALEEAGLKVSVEQEYDDEVESGDVIRQSVEAGTEVEIGSEVTIVVSKGSNKVPVPNLIGKTLTEASEALEERGLSLSSNYNEEYSDSIEAERIMGQSIDADTTVELGTSVTVTLSKGKSTVTVPNLSGTKEDMERLLRDAGLTPNVTEEYSDAAAGTILSMSHASGTAVAPGTTIDVVLSLGPKMVAVPPIVGSSQEAAEKALREAELNVNVKDRREDSSAAGTVIGCDPGEGKSVKAGSVVNIVVSTGPAPTTTAAPTTAAPTTAAPTSGRSESESDIAGTTAGTESE